MNMDKFLISILFSVFYKFNKFGHIQSFPIIWFNIIIMFFLLNIFFLNKGDVTSPKTLQKECHLYLKYSQLHLLFEITYPVGVKFHLQEVHLHTNPFCHYPIYTYIVYW